MWQCYIAVALTVGTCRCEIHVQCCAVVYSTYFLPKTAVLITLITYS